MNGLVK